MDAAVETPAPQMTTIRRADLMVVTTTCKAKSGRDVLEEGGEEGGVREITGTISEDKYNARRSSKHEDHSTRHQKEGYLQEG